MTTASEQAPPSDAHIATLMREMVLDALPADCFDRALRIVLRATGAAGALFALTAEGDLRCKASLGIASSEMPRALALCAAAIGIAPLPAAPGHHSTSLLLGPDGSTAGVLCALGGDPAQADQDQTTLDDAAHMVMSDLELRARSLDAQRQVQTLNLRNTILATAGAAGDVASALEHMMATICDAAGAALCHVWHLGPDGGRLRLVGGVARGRLAGTSILSELRGMRVDIANTLLGAPLRNGEQLITPSVQDEDVTRQALLQLSRRHGLVSRIATPLRVGADGYILLTGFDSQVPDLSGVAALVKNVTQPMLPVLQRQRDHERAELFRRVVEATSDAVLITEAEPLDEPGPRILYVNAAFERMTGYTAAEVVGRSPRMLQGERTEAAARSAIRAGLAAGRPVRQEITNYRKDGTRFIMDVNAAPLTDSMGNLTHYVAVQRDMDAYYRAARDTTRREAAFRRLFHSNPVPMWIYDRVSLRFLEVNHAATVVYGWSRDEFLAMSILDIRPDEERAAVTRSAAAPGSGRMVTGPWRHLNASGEECLVQIMSSPLMFEDHPATLVAAFDITEQTRAEQAARRSEADLQRTTGVLAEAMRMARLGTWRRRLDHQVAEWSDEIYTMAGADRDSFVPTTASLMERIHPDDRALYRQMMGRTVAGEGAASFEFRLVRPDGSICNCWSQAQLQPDPDGGPPWLVGMSQDVTERRQTEQALLRAEKLSTIGQMTGGIAHDFNNLLTVISISLEMADEMAGEAAPLQPLLRAARDAADKGAQLTAQLLSYARRQPLRPIAVSPSDFASDLLEMLPRVLGERHTIHTTIAPNTPRFVVDPAQLEAAMLNLFLNARDAMPKGGPIGLALSPITFSEDYAARQDEVQPGRYVMIAVADRGTGMTPETLARVFEPFFTTKPVGKGTGLGLSMVLGFAKQSGGHVSIYSEPDKGTVVKLYLPQADTRTSTAVAAPVTAGPLPPVEVLVVEDKDDVRAITCRLCTDLGLVPTAAASAEEALTYFSAGFRFGLLFTDIVLAGAMDGVQLAERAREIQPDLPVLFTSGYTASAVIDPGDGKDSIRLLSKPYSKTHFVEAVAAVLAGAATG